MDYNKLFKDWYNKNPLRVYRKEQKQNLEIIAARLGVAIYTIQRWEKGTRPTDENMQKLKDLLGDDCEERWEKWINDKPQ